MWTGVMGTRGAAPAMSQPTSPAATLTRCHLLSATRDGAAVFPVPEPFWGPRAATQCGERESPSWAVGVLFPSHVLFPSPW